ncbi:acetolactate synthase isozyme 3 large subunit [mine drainage metagenome]|uniref:Acetolactate synthase isozyme 3 large subunit n=1 Tax=mine drainage metagenome TaxID=410659 RepID=A0A1J5PWN4_9ZZZZ
MGVGLPYAMGIKLAKPEAEAVCVTGDGSIQMNIQELATCLQYETAVKIILLNNRYLGMVRQWQEIEYEGRYSHSYMDSLPDFVKLAEAYGHVGIKVDRPEDLRPAMEKAFAMKDRTVFLDISVDPTENVWPMIQAGRGITDMLLGAEDL